MSSEQTSVATVEATLRAVGEALVASRDRLNDLDGVAGDGDLGLTVGRIGAVCIDLASELASLEPAKALRRLGLEIGQRAPSTFGTLISLGLIAAGRSEQESPDPKLVGPVEVVSRLVSAAENGIADRGKASRGDKSLLDALGPAADALAEAARGAVAPIAALRAAADAAAAGVESTRTMEPRVGRQLWLADRASGSPDAGAEAIRIAFAAAADAAT